MDDLISRHATVDLIERMKPYHQDADDIAEMIANMPPSLPNLDEWCTDCKEHDNERHCCPRWNRVIRQTVEDMKAAQPREDIRAMCGECDAWNQYKNYPHRWIPCTPETMPEREGRYVCTYTYDGKKDVFMFRFEDGDFLVPWYVETVTAWYKPLDPWESGQ